MNIRNLETRMGIGPGPEVPLVVTLRSTQPKPPGTIVASPTRDRDRGILHPFELREYETRVVDEDGMEKPLGLVRARSGAGALRKGARILAEQGISNG